MKSNQSSRPSQWSMQLNIIRVLIIEIVIFIALIITSFAHLQFWYLIGSCVGIGLLGIFFCCIAFRAHTFPGWAAVWYSYLRNCMKYQANNAPFMQPLQVNQFQGIGSIAHGDYFISVIELFAPTRSPVFVERGLAEYMPGATVPIDPLIDALHQYDVILHSIDIINIGSRISSRSSYNTIYNSILTESPAVGKRRTFIIIRVRPADLLKAIQLRGGGAIGMSKTLNIVTRRTLRLLKEEGVQANILTKDQIEETIPTLYEKLLPQKSTILEEHYALEKWSHVEIDQMNIATTYAIDPASWTIENQNAWWRGNTVETTTIMRITPASNDGRDGAYVTGWIRFITEFLPSIEVIETSGIRLIHGQQLRLASLPIFHLSPLMKTDAQSVHIFPGDNRFFIPIGPTGQFLGYTTTNRQVYMDLCSSGGTHLAPRYILKNIDQKFISQLALRALSTGAKIKVHSPDWSHWRYLIESTQSSNIWIEGDNDREDATIVIYDRAIARGELPSRTIISIDVEDHFPKNVIVGMNSPHYENPFEIHVDLGGGDIGIVIWSVNKAEDQYLSDMSHSQRAYDSDYYYY